MMTLHNSQHAWSTVEEKEQEMDHSHVASLGSLQLTFAEEREASSKQGITNSDFSTLLEVPWDSWLECQVSC